MVATLLISLTLGGSSPEPAAEPRYSNATSVRRQCSWGGDWVVYGCVDGRSVIVVASLPNPAALFVFIITPDDSGGIELHGEGTGAKSATKPAYDVLGTMSGSDLAVLFQRARQAHRP